jgi:hypothetical protein
MSGHFSYQIWLSAVYPRTLPLVPVIVLIQDAFQSHKWTSVYRVAIRPYVATLRDQLSVLNVGQTIDTLLNLSVLIDPLDVTNAMH